ncbi:peptidoglycan DD-metalloendopeptidase family protein [Variovorax saccharolyticus]|uniref:peptidoglycan DD-metalloendopeptidase family protein n=1 Tax=Variovorax saccharolyticus TaxID=3053516 RepID=UPI003369D8D0
MPTAAPPAHRSWRPALVASVLCAALGGCAAPPPPASPRAVSGQFGSYVWPAYGPTLGRFDGRANKGIDIGGNPGDPVLAAAAGRVVYAGAGVRGYGNLVIVKHDDTFLTAYGHNSRVLVREHDVVRAGQQIAEMGSTDTTTTKLHFEVRRAGVAVDPEPYLQAQRARPPAAAGAPPGAPPGAQASAPAGAQAGAQAGGAARPRAGRVTGSGFAVAPGHVVTNAHVVEGCGKIVVVERGTARVKAADARSDLALLEVDAVMAPTARLSQTRLRQGDPVTVVGYPLRGLLAAGPQVTAGHATALAGLANNTALIQISAPVQPGNSGGPVLDASGNVVAVVTGKLNVLRAAAVTGDIAQNINFAVAPSALRGFLDAHNVSYEAAPSSKSLGTADVADIGRRFTVLVECTRE